LPSEVKLGALGLRFDEPQFLLDALGDVEGLLLSSLLAAGEPE
jgi:hypothetical protein